MIAVLTDDDRELFLAGSVVDQKIESSGHRHSVTGKQQHWDDGARWELRDIFRIHIYIFVITTTTSTTTILIIICVAVRLAIVSICSDHGVRVITGVLDQLDQTGNIYNRLPLPVNFVFDNF